MSGNTAERGEEAHRKADGAREELHAILSARHELGTEYNDELADMLMERLDAVIDRRVEARLQDVSGSDMSPAVPICSFIFAIPATAIVASLTGPLGVAFVWAAVVLVNILYSGKKISDIF